MQPIDSENSQSSYLWWILLMVTFLALLMPHTDTSAMVNSKHLVKTLVVSGTLEIVDSDQRVAGIEVRINGQTSLSTDGGRYQATIAKADVYHMAFSRDDLFQTVQTFAHSELEKSASSGVEIPTIELVEKKPGRVELIFGGDVMMGRRYIRPRWNEPQLIHGTTRKEDMEKLIQHMRPYFESADYGAVNLETVLSVDDPGAHAPKGVVFYTDPQILEALKTMGVDYVSLGNNHIYDYLDKGLDATVAALDRSGIGFSGAGTNEQEALLPYQTTIKDQHYAMLGYVGWKGRVTPNQIAEENKAGAALGTTANIIASVKQAEQAGGTTVVQYHGSREYSEAPTEITEKRLKAAVDAGADLVVGHHPHVAHGLELYKGKLIAYSLGNFIFDQFIYEAQAAYALKVWMDGDRFYRAEIIPVHLRAYRPVPAMAGVRRHILQRVFHLSAKRGTFLTLSGGHGVITQNSGVRKAEREYD
jgi:poly-gamma-glutamate capsule biosynthesis protein CapA/YwtB (metallophosphatase superfamily)